MSIMHYNGCFPHQTTPPRISANGLSREIYFRTPISTRTTAVRRGVLLQDVGVCGGRRNLDQIEGVNPCVLVALRHGFSSLPYCFNSCNVYGRSSSCRRRLWSKLAAFEDSTTPNVPVVQGVVLQDAGEDEELPNPTSENGSSIASFAQEKVSSTTGYWSSLPPRYKLVLTTSLAMVICNMDKVNMSVAIIPMSRQMGWNSSVAGLVQSSFFWGYAVSQLPGGWLAAHFSGQTVLRAGVFIWSLATAAVPCVASFIPGLLFCRLLVGLGEGVSPAAATDLIARVMPVTERSRAVGTVFGGLYVGSVIGLLLAPVIIKHIGWEAVFYIFGFVGVLWCSVSEIAVRTDGIRNAAPISDSTGSTQKPFSVSGNGLSSTNHDCALQQRQPKATQSSRESDNIPSLSATLAMQHNEAIPWRAFFKSKAVLAMIYAHFCGNWGHYTLLSWLPTYFCEELHLHLTHAALVSILPPLVSVVVASIAAPLADHFISHGTDITLVRKVCQSIAFLAPAACLAIASAKLNVNPWVKVAVLATGIGLSSFTLAGLYCTYQDISPKYAGILSGLTCTAGAIPGALGVALVGIIFDRTHSWNIALFAPSIFFYLTGFMVWNLFASSEPQNFTS
ncbi:unnamed protein product [Sphagnum troendelagicum]|uniref:Major facilitator superfamily (MFS) profile domain-containing protein n=1 Tax=Sphagnum troendelagicum TaxID=128251 RepID=A0ABP0UG95_9BRYO